MTENCSEKKILYTLSEHGLERYHTLQVCNSNGGLTKRLLTSYSSNSSKRQGNEVGRERN